MKNLTKIIALAAIAALAVISCSPEVTVSDYDWGRANQQFDSSLTPATVPPGLDLSDINFSMSEDNAETRTADNASVYHFEIDIDFAQAEQADVLRENDILAGLKKFLSFHNAVRDAADTAPNLPPNEANVDKLSDPIPYSLVKTAGTTITVKLDKEYVAGASITTTYSNIVYKIDSTAFTYARGLKVDTDQNGVPGESGYDDYYDEISITGAAAYSVVLPSLEPLSFAIGTVSGYNFLEKKTASEVMATLPAATLTLPPGASYSQDMQNSIASTFGTAFKLQKYTNNAWVTFATSKVTQGTADIAFDNITLDHQVPHRIIWEGDADPKTAQEYFGLKQRVFITTTASSQVPHDVVHLRNLKQIEGAAAIPNNSNIMRFNTIGGGVGTLTAYSYDLEGRNVVLDLKVSVLDNSGDNPAPAVTTYYGLKQIDLSAFANSFKVVVETNGSSNNYSYVNIVKVEFLSDSTTAKEEKVLDHVRITLDPSYVKGSGDVRSILINNGISYTNDRDVFGVVANVDFYELYDASAIF